MAKTHHPICSTNAIISKEAVVSASSFNKVSNGMATDTPCISRLREK